MSKIVLVALWLAVGACGSSEMATKVEPLAVVETRPVSTMAETTTPAAVVEPPIPAEPPVAAIGMMQSITTTDLSEMTVRVAVVERFGDFNDALDVGTVPALDEKRGVTIYYIEGNFEETAPPEHIAPNWKVESWPMVYAAIDSEGNAIAGGFATAEQASTLKALIT